MRRLFSRFGVVVVVFALLGVPIIPVAALSCLTTQNVATLAQLNTTLANVQSCTTAGTYTILFTSGFNLSAHIEPYYQLTSGIDLVIDGGGFVIDAGYLWSGFYFDGLGKVTIKNLTLQHFYNLQGAAIETRMTLVVQNSTLKENRAEYYGSAIMAILDEVASESLWLDQTTFIANRSPNGGGAVQVWSQGNVPIIVNQSAFRNNSSYSGNGGLIVNNQGGKMARMIQINRSVFVNSYTAVGWGGALSLTGDAVDATRPKDIVWISRSRFASNRAPKPPSSGGLNYARGGALALQGLSATVELSSFSHNQSYAGGAIYASGTFLTIDSSTFYANSAVSKGGALAWFDSYTVSKTHILRNTTFSANQAPQGSAVYVEREQVFLYNNILANSVGGQDCTQSNGAVLTFSPGLSNIIETGNCGTAGVTHRTVDPMLGALVGNFYLPLLAGSPAINTGDNATCAARSQNNLVRPRGGVCDLGSYETP